MNIETIYIVGFIITWIGTIVYYIMDNPFDNSILFPSFIGIFFAMVWPLIWVVGIVGGLVGFIVLLFVK